MRKQMERKGKEVRKEWVNTEGGGRKEDGRRTNEETRETRMRKGKGEGSEERMERERGKN